MEFYLRLLLKDKYYLFSCFATNSSKQDDGKIKIELFRERVILQSINYILAIDTS